MQITRQATSASIWQRIKVQHLSLVCGLTLAVGSAIALGGWQDSSHPPSREQSRLPTIARAPEADTPYVAFYLVTSQAGADLAAAYEAQVEIDRAMTNSPPVPRTVQVLSVATAAEDALARSLISEASLQEVSIAIVDLRHR